ncbi:MAG: contractile injection system tape measure protein [Bacteroidota bacterium]
MTGIAHSIKKQVIQVNMTSEKHVREIQSMITSIARIRLPQVLNQVLEKHNMPGFIVKLDKIEIDAGSIKVKDIRKLSSIVSKKLDEYLDRKISEMKSTAFRPNGSRLISLSQSMLESLRYFLLYGRLPWWAQQEKMTPGKLFDQLIEDNPNALSAMIRKNADNEKFVTRLTLQLSPSRFFNLFQLLSGNNGLYVKSTIKSLARENAHLERSSSRLNSRIYAFALLNLLRSKELFTKKKFLENMQGDISEAYPEQIKKAGPSFKDLFYQEILLLEILETQPEKILGILKNESRPEHLSTRIVQQLSFSTYQEILKILVRKDFDSIDKMLKGLTSNFKALKEPILLGTYRELNAKVRQLILQFYMSKRGASDFVQLKKYLVDVLVKEQITTSSSAQSLFYQQSEDQIKSLHKDYQSIVLHFIDSGLFIPPVSVIGNAISFQSVVVELLESGKFPFMEVFKLIAAKPWVATRLAENLSKKQLDSIVRIGVRKHGEMLVMYTHELATKYRAIQPSGKMETTVVAKLFQLIAKGLPQKGFEIKERLEQEIQVTVGLGTPGKELSNIPHPDPEKHVQQSEIFLIEHFLNFGTFPVWKSDFSDLSLDEFVVKLIDEQPAELKELVLSMNPKLISDRLVQQLTPETVTAFTIFLTENAPFDVLELKMKVRAAFEKTYPRIFSPFHLELAIMEHLLGPERHTDAIKAEKLVAQRLKDLLTLKDDPVIRKRFSFKEIKQLVQSGQWPSDFEAKLETNFLSLFRKYFEEEPYEILGIMEDIPAHTFTGPVREKVLKVVLSHFSNAPSQSALEQMLTHFKTIASAPGNRQNSVAETVIDVIGFVPEMLEGLISEAHPPEIFPASGKVEIDDHLITSFLNDGKLIENFSADYLTSYIGMKIRQKDEAFLELLSTLSSEGISTRLDENLLQELVAYYASALSGFINTFQKALRKIERDVIRPGISIKQFTWMPIVSAVVKPTSVPVDTTTFLKAVIQNLNPVSRFNAQELVFRLRQVTSEAVKKSEMRFYPLHESLKAITPDTLEPTLDKSVEIPEPTSEMPSSRMAILRMYLTKGTLPGNATKIEPGALDALFLDLLEKDPQQVATLVRFAPPERLASQFTDESLTVFIEKIFPSFSGFIQTLHLALAEVYDEQGDAYIKFLSRKQFSWEPILHYLLNQQPETYDTTELVKLTISKAADLVESDIEILAGKLRAISQARVDVNDTRFFALLALLDPQAGLPAWPEKETEPAIQPEQETNFTDSSEDVLEAMSDWLDAPTLQEANITSDKDLDEAIHFLLDKNPKEVLHLLKSKGASEAVVTIIVRQLHEDTLVELLRYLDPANWSKLLTWTHLLQSLYEQHPVIFTHIKDLDNWRWKDLLINKIDENRLLPIEELVSHTLEDLVKTTHMPKRDLIESFYLISRERTQKGVTGFQPFFDLFSRKVASEQIIIESSDESFSLKALIKYLSTDPEGLAPAGLEQKTQEFIDKKPLLSRPVLWELAGSPELRSNLLSGFSKETINQVIYCLQPQKGKEIPGYLEDLFKILSKPFIMDQLFEHLHELNTTAFDIKPFFKSVLEGYAKDKSQLIQLVDNTAAFLQVVRPASGKELTDVLNEMAEELMPSEEKQQAEKKPYRKLGEMTEQLKEEVYIKNAGLVLLWPYFAHYFNLLGMTENDEFKSKEHALRAVHLLQVLVTGQTETPEYELVLNKIFCGLPIAEPVPAGIDLTEQETEISQKLFQVAMNSWDKVKNLPVANFRGSFLIRNGRLEEQSANWVLRVEREPFDMLLDTLPWTISMIKLPWMLKLINVEWR